jgi:hydrogenase/urease accessory protein HupE
MSVRTRAPVATSVPRGLHLCAWCLGAAMVEVGLYASYRGHDARFHWFTHFFVGATAALAVMIVVAAARGRPVPLPFVWVSVGHLVAMAPDLAFVAGVAHRRWMDVFLGHISAHYVPGRNWTWYAVFLASLAAYLAVVDSLRPERGP